VWAKGNWVNTSRRPLSSDESTGQGVSCWLPGDRTAIDLFNLIWSPGWQEGGRLYGQVWTTKLLEKAGPPTVKQNSTKFKQSCRTFAWATQATWATRWGRDARDSQGYSFGGSALWGLQVYFFSKWKKFSECTFSPMAMGADLP